ALPRWPLDCCFASRPRRRARPVPLRAPSATRPLVRSPGKARRRRRPSVPSWAPELSSPLPPVRAAVTPHLFPDFYLVGTPKCGTTAFYGFLAQHPQIFLPETKQLLFFGSDLSYPSRLSDA